MVSHIPLQVGLCPQKEKDFSAVESGLCVWFHTALHPESAHVAPKPLGKRESATGNEPILETNEKGNGNRAGSFQEVNSIGVKEKKNELVILRTKN